MKFDLQLSIASAFWSWILLNLFTMNLNLKKQNNSLGKLTTEDFYNQSNESILIDGGIFSEDINLIRCTCNQTIEVPTGFEIID